MGMGKPYSQDLRDRVIEAVEQGGMSRRGGAAASVALARNRFPRSRE
jgi:hypothetical protein